MPVFIDHAGAMRHEDNRNIKEEYRWWDHEEIVADLDQTRSDMVAIFNNVHGDFNLSTGIRNALAYNIRGVWIAGNKRWDTRGAVGAHHYLNMNHAADIHDIIDNLRAEGYRIVAAEITDDAVPLDDTYTWDSKSAVIFGEEQNGIEQEILDLVDDVVYIPMYGSIRSFNVGVSSGIFMFSYANQMHRE